MRIFKWTLLIILIFLVLGLVVWKLKSRGGPSGQNKQGNQTTTPTSTGDYKQINQRLGGKDCQGQGSKTLTHLPMRPEDFSHILPYGLMIGGHVTPVDHWYFAPADYQSPRDAYPVFAIADSTLTSIQRRVRSVEDPSKKSDEYRLVFTYSCTFLTYYDLVTSLEPRILEKAPQLKKENFAQVEIPVKAGEQIGKIGGQTLDFAVWDITKPLTGFVNPKSYEGEPWKIYTANPFDYFSPEINELMKVKIARSVEPIWGKIDYDIDGKLVGNWFLEGSGGIADSSKERYWQSHLSVVYDYLDPGAVEVSFGDFEGKEKQFMVKGNAPDPASVGEEAGLVKYELLENWEYYKGDGARWDKKSAAQNLKIKPNEQMMAGTVLFQVLENRRLKMETFPGQKASEVNGFSEKVKVYQR